MVMRMNCLSVGEKIDRESRGMKLHVRKTDKDRETRGTVTSCRFICRIDQLRSILFQFLSPLLPRLLDPSLISRRHSH